MKIMVILFLLVACLSAPCAGRNDEVVQVVDTLLGVATTDPSAVNADPGQMLVVAWKAPFPRFEKPERMTVQVVVLDGGRQGRIMVQLVDLLAGMTKNRWVANQSRKNLSFFTGKPVVGDLVVLQTLSYVVGQSSSKGSSSGSQSYSGSGYGSGGSHSSSTYKVEQESFVNLHTEIIRKGPNGQDDVLFVVPDIQAYESGQLSSREEDSSSAHNFGGRKGWGYSNSSCHFDSWSWTKSADLLEAQSARSLALYLASGSYALICQAMEKEKALSP